MQMHTHMHAHTLNQKAQGMLHMHPPYTYAYTAPQDSDLASPLPALPQGFEAVQDAPRFGSFTVELEAQEADQCVLCAPTPLCAAINVAE